MDHTYLYQCRFSELEQKKRMVFWQTLSDCFLSQFIRPTMCVVDIGAGSLEFLKSIRVKKKIAVDPLFRSRIIKSNIACYPSIRSLSKNLSHAVDVVMLSNVLEHMSNRDEIMRTLSDIRRLLAPTGTLLVIQPTIDLVGVRYWDFFDHITPITRSSLKEALIVSGFTVEEYIPRFLPYTTKMVFPMPAWVLRLYLFIPWFLRPFAGQCFIRAAPVLKGVAFRS